MAQPSLTILGVVSIGLIGAGVWLRSAPDEQPPVLSAVEAPAAGATTAPAAPEPAPKEVAPPPEDLPSAAELQPPPLPGVVSGPDAEPAVPPPDEGGGRPQPNGLIAVGPLTPQGEQLITGEVFARVPAAAADAAASPPPQTTDPGAPSPDAVAAAGPGVAATPGFAPITFGPETRMHQVLPERMTVMERATFEAELRTLAPQPYFGAVAFSGNRVVFGAGGYASLKAAEAAVLARCAQSAANCRIGVRFLPEGFDGQRSGTLSHHQAEVWHAFLSAPLTTSSVIRSFLAFAWSEDGVALYFQMPSEESAESIARLRCDVERMKLRRPTIPSDPGCRIGATRGR